VTGDSAEAIITEKNCAREARRVFLLRLVQGGRCRRHAAFRPSEQMPVNSDKRSRKHAT
jgi:hypothetical protein